MTKVIGLTGPMGSGKGTIVKLLQEKGYKSFKYSDVIRDELKIRQIKETRKSLQDIGDDLRKKYGLYILSEMLSIKIKEQGVQFAIVDGVRNPGEVIYLRQNLDNFKLIGLIASANTRFNLIRERNRPSDLKTRAEFDILEKRDRGEGESKCGQQVQACLDMADIIIENEGTVEELKANFLSINDI